MNRSLLTLLLGVLIVLPTLAQPASEPASPAVAVEEVKWMSIEEAYALQAKTPKKIFIDVYTNWCGWCKRMDATTFSDPRIARYMNEHYYNVKLDAETSKEIILSGQKFVNPNPEGRRSTHQLAATLLGGQMSYPSYVFLDEKTEKLTVVKGYMQVDGFEPILHFFATGSYLKQSWEEYQQGWKKAE
jgi:thioredoxin-related protein